ncbi:MAG: Sec-independent protein translocase protein TatB [Brachymonas sp.]|nr:Sec-independent protein translocase protein TatB [Brachymonas sp.]
MFDLGFSKLLVVGFVAMLVVGPEKLPELARTLGTWVGRMQRHLNQVKQEMGGLQELQELRDMKRTMEQAAWDAQHQMQTMASRFERDVGLASRYAHAEVEDVYDTGSARPGASTQTRNLSRKNWRLKRHTIPQWYKSRQRPRTSALSNAARVARQRDLPSGK